jgi:glycine/D-amino acid oxidase-like deaminating enzyme
MQYEFIIVGQGISGTFLSYYLHKEQRNFLVIDNNDSNTPSRIAAGIINPVTGRRMVTVWMAEEVIPFAKQAYEEIGNELNIRAISQKNIIDFFPNPFMRESFLKRIEENNEYVQLCSDQQQLSKYFNYVFGCGEINPVYTAHLESLLPAWRQKLTERQQLLEENFDIEQLEITPDKVLYKDIEADTIIFCDGPDGISNRYFKQLPYAPNKGEALVVEIPGLPANTIYKKSMLLAPLQTKESNLFWVGSTYAWDFENADPTKEFRERTEQLLQEWLKLPFKITEHRSGIRPATLERRPFVGLHPLYQNIGIVNGMGTKGCSLAPFFAKQFTNHLLHNVPITPDADVKRFSKILAR